MNWWPWVLVVVVGVLLLLASSGVAAVSSSTREQDRIWGKFDVPWIHRLNAVVIGLAVTAYGVYKILD